MDMARFEMLWEVFTKDIIVREFAMGLEHIGGPKVKSM
jgi:hypothetical protein